MDEKKSFQILEQLRQEELSRFGNNKIIAEVKRDNIFYDMMQLYRKRRTVTNTIAVTFVGEEAVGEGVSKDAYSAFFESWYKTMDGEQEKIPSNTNFDDEDLEIIGKIIQTCHSSGLGRISGLRGFFHETFRLDLLKIVI